MSRTQLPNTTTGISYDKKQVVLGSVVRNIESGFTGRVVAWESINGDDMIRCIYEYADGTLDGPMDCQWFAPADMVVVDRKLEWSALWNAMKANPDSWIETTENMNWEQLCVLPPAAGGNGYFLVGEPARHNAEGKPVFACFRTVKDRYFAKYQTYAEFKKNR